MRDGEVDVARLAIRAVGARKRAEFVPELLARLGHPELSDDAARSLAGLGEAAVPPLRERLFDPEAPLEARREIPAVLVRIGTPGAQRALMEGLLQGDPTLRRRIVASLNRLRHRQPQLPVETELVETVLAAEITGHYRSHQILHRLAPEEGREEPALGGLRHSMEEELERIFGLLALLGPGEDLLRAHRALRSEDKRARADALELLDNVLRPPLRRLVVPLVDGHVSVAERAALGERLVGAPLDTREEAVAVLAACGDAWLRSCAARIIGALGLRTFEPQLVAWLEDPDPLLREAARSARRQLRAEAPGAVETVEAAAGAWTDSTDRLGVG
jgi:AAA family ATP:ADP antiporter